MIVTCHPRTLHFIEPAGTSRGVYLTRKVWYVCIHRQSAHTFGIGECAPLPGLSCDDVPNYETILREACHRLAIHQAIPYELLRPYPSILFGFETAWQSLIAMEEGRSPLTLYDTPFSRGEQGIAINGLVWMGSFEEMLRRMESKVEQGFRCIKIKVGAIDWEQELTLIRTLRSRFSADVLQIRLDANGAFPPVHALQRLQELSHLDIHSIEQPIRQGQYAEMARLCAGSPIPIALDEELIGVHTIQEKQALLDRLRPQYLILKPSLHGGFSGCDEWIGLARQRGIGYWVTSALESNIGLNAIAQWCALQQPQIPQGLGTGLLFSDNVEATDLRIIADKLWCAPNRQQRKFQEELESFRKEWEDISSQTIKVYTSGSTGEPRPYEVEKSRMEASARMTLDYLQIKAGETALLCLPLKYIAGKMMAIRSFVGGLRLQAVAPSSHPLHTIASLLDAEGFWQQNHTNRSDSGLPRELGTRLHPLVPDFIALTPMQAWHTLQDASEQRVFCHIPHIIIGGGSISEALHTAVQQCHGAVYSSYGMTETLSHIALRLLNGPHQSDAYTLLPGIRISTNPDGCLCIDAPQLSPQTLQTHDIVRIRPDGSFTVLGRTDNIISSGGIKLSLDAIEQRIGMLPFSYQLTAVPDVALGEALTLLYVAPTNQPISINELQQLLKTRLETYECPRHFLGVETLPLTETGKPARTEARQIAAEAWKKIHQEWQ